MKPKMNQVKEASSNNNSTKIKTSSMISSRGSNQDLIELETQALLSQPDGKSTQLSQSSYSSSSYSPQLSFTYYVVNFFPNLFSSKLQSKREELYVKKNK